MEIIGITGQIGAGKSTVCASLRKRGYTHIDADAVAKSLYVPGGPLLAKLSEIFGSQILTTTGELDKKALAAIAFSSPERTKQLNDAVHPAVTEKIRQNLQTLLESGAKWVIIEAIALYESGENALCDRTVGVIAPEEVRLSRVMARDGLTKEEALFRIRSQKPESFFTEHCDCVLRNYPPYDLEEEIQRIFPL